jgi:vacuolar-type H+-ATPase subunit E/Vma4
MRQEAEHFGEQELDLVYVAKRLKEALRLEQVFTDAGLDYLVEPDRYSGGVIFRTERVGAFFYVAPENATAAREVIEKEGLETYAAGG